MNTRKMRMAALVLAVCLSGTAQAALQGRDLNGSIDSFEAFYDTDLNITWLADANYARTSGLDADGVMDWFSATTWAANLSFTDGVNVYDNWRLPTTTDTGTPGYQCTNSGTDCGYNANPDSSELAHLYFTELGNLSYYNVSGAVSGAYAGGTNPNSTLDNTGQFINFQSGGYWSGTEYALDPSGAWVFDTDIGYQDFYDHKTSYANYALAVHSGDVALIPEPETYAMMLAGLGLVGFVARRRKQIEA